MICLGLLEAGLQGRSGHGTWYEVPTMVKTVCPLSMLIIAGSLSSPWTCMHEAATPARRMLDRFLERKNMFVAFGCSKKLLQLQLYNARCSGCISASVLYIVVLDSSARLLADAPTTCDHVRSMQCFKALFPPGHADAGREECCMVRLMFLAMYVAPDLDCASEVTAPSPLEI